jgi:hypothetical protein
MSVRSSNSLIDLVVTIVIPSVILMKFSGEADLGSVNALLLALAFPLAWGASTSSAGASSTGLRCWA